MSEQTQNQALEQTPSNSPENPESSSPNQQQNQQQTPQESQQQTQTPTRSSSDLEAENRALRAILSGHVGDINIDEELEFVGPTGKYRPANQPQQEQVSEQRTSRRQGLQNARAEEAPGVDIAAIDKEFDNYLKNSYGFDMSGGTND